MVKTIEEVFREIDRVKAQIRRQESECRALEVRSKNCPVHDGEHSTFSRCETYKTMREDVKAAKDVLKRLDSDLEDRRLHMHLLKDLELKCAAYGHACRRLDAPSGSIYPKMKGRGEEKHRLYLEQDQAMAAVRNARRRLEAYLGLATGSLDPVPVPPPELPPRDRPRK